MNEKIVIDNQKIIQSINSTSESIDNLIKQISEKTTRISRLVSSSSKEHHTIT